MSGSSVHSQWINFQRRPEHFPNDTPIEFKAMSDTRWACQVRAVSAILARFDCFIQFLRHVLTSDTNRERALTAHSILAQIDQTFIFCMLLMNDVLRETKGASDILQSPKLDYIKASYLIEALMEELQIYRSDEKAEEYFKMSSDIAVRNGLKCCRPKRAKSTPSTLEDFAVLSTLGKRDAITDSSGMKRAILYPTVDAFLGELNKRFSAENLQIFRSLSALDPTSEKFLDFNTVKPLAEHYSLNLGDIEMEMRQAKRMNERSGATFATVEEFADHLAPLYMAFTELVKVLQIAITLPVSTAGCERSFSKLLLIKNHLRFDNG